MRFLNQVEKQWRELKKKRFKEANQAVGRSQIARKHFLNILQTSEVLSVF